MNDIKALYYYYYYHGYYLLLSLLLFIIFFELTPFIVRCYVTVDSLAYLRRA